jgi:hypothetical protein
MHLFRPTYLLKLTRFLTTIAADVIIRILQTAFAMKIFSQPSKNGYDVIRLDLHDRRSVDCLATKV